MSDYSIRHDPDGESHVGEWLGMTMLLLTIGIVMTAVMCVATSLATRP